MGKIVKHFSLESDSIRRWNLKIPSSSIKFNYRLWSRWNEEEAYILLWRYRYVYIFKWCWLLALYSSHQCHSLLLIIFISTAAHFVRVRNLRYLPEVEISRFAPHIGAKSPIRGRRELGVTVFKLCSLMVAAGVVWNRKLDIVCSRLKNTYW